MTVSGKVAGAPPGASLIDDGRPDGNPFTAVWALLLSQAGALSLQVLAVVMARDHASAQANALSCCGFALAFASALWMLTRPRLARSVRNTAVVCLGLTTTLQCRVTNPLLFRGYDEQLHMRTFSDIESSHGLFQPNPLLTVSPRYPGLESVAALFHQIGLPTMAAATAVVVLARLVLVLALCDTVEHLTGSPRAGGLAVAVYAVSAQFVLFNSQFAYQTLALPLALAAAAFIVRARWVSDPRLLLGGATVCLMAVAVTHHLTSLLTAGFLAVWMFVQRGSQARRRVFYGAMVAAVATTAWATIQWSLLRDYFGPIVDDVQSQVTGQWRRQLFSDSAGYAKPLWEQVFLIYYAAAVTLVVLCLMLIWARALLRRMRGSAPRSKFEPWEPRVMLVLMVAMIPVLMAARTVPKFGEIGDRSSGFLFLPLSLLVADGVARWWRSRPRHSRGAARRVPRVRLLVLMLATGVFVGGYLLGSGPDWAWLPGGHPASADNRSIGSTRTSRPPAQGGEVVEWDGETLAAVRWARDGLPAGSRIGADRMVSVMLSSRAGLWPILHEGDLDVQSLYVADEWGPPQSELARRLHLRYLYVDLRLADEVPARSYFWSDATSEPHQFTRVQLTKFDNVAGIHPVYRRGPIVVYDLSGLGVPERRTGWVGEIHPSDVRIQLVIGLFFGLAFAFVGASRAWHTVITFLRSFKTAAGPSLTFAAGLAALCVASVTMLLAHIWLGPTAFLTMALVVLFANPRRAISLLRNSAARLHWRWIAVSAVVGLLVVAALALSIRDASATDATHVTSTQSPFARPPDARAGLC
jgi:hypothetical protein